MSQCGNLFSLLIKIGPMIPFCILVEIRFLIIVKNGECRNQTVKMLLSREDNYIIYTSVPIAQIQFPRLFPFFWF